jgi:hypothetical protein
LKDEWVWPARLPGCLPPSRSLFLSLSLSLCSAALRAIVHHHARLVVSRHTQPASIEFFTNNVLSLKKIFEFKLQLLILIIFVREKNLKKLAVRIVAAAARVSIIMPVIMTEKKKKMKKKKMMQKPLY